MMVGEKRTLPLEWLFSALIAATGIKVFGRFEERTPRWKRLSKWAAYFGVTALLSRTAGRPLAFGWIFGLPVLGMGFHLWWCRRHGINSLTAEPKDKYYELRGWTA